MTRSSPRIVVAGAGLQGTSVALALAHRGYHVVLLESRVDPVTAASRGSEGKIHLGFVYSLDETRETQRRMVEGALCFSPLLDRWCGPLAWDKWRSDRFRYAVMPDTMASDETLEAAYEDLREIISGYDSHPLCQPSYVGHEISWLWRESDAPAREFFKKDFGVRRLFDTEEVSIDTRFLSQRLGEVLRAHPLIDLRCGVRVDRAERTGSGFRLALAQHSPAGNAEETSTVEADIVVNCTWSDRRRLDATLGIGTRGPETCYRIKHQIMVRPIEQATPLVPLTLVQGPYGDVVPRSDGQVYISWYPECRTYFGIVPPAEVLTNRANDRQVAERSLATMQTFVPALAGAEIVSSQAGVIVAQGVSDIHDPQSALHSRTDHGVFQHDHWWSIDTGKLTTAPQQGEEAAQQIVRSLA